MFARLSPCAKTQNVTLTHFLWNKQSQSVLPLLGIFHQIWSFPVSFIFLLNIWGLFDSGQIFEMYVVLPYFPLKNTVVS